MLRLITLSTCIASLLLLAMTAARAQSWGSSAEPGAISKEDATALAKKRQDPIGDLYTFPFQNNINFGTGPHKGTQDVLNFQPVIPFRLDEDWKIITRTMLPFTWQTSLQPAPTVPFGTGPTTYTAYLSPRDTTNGWLWGVGPAIQIPTTTDKSLGSNVWGGGPAGVLVYKKGPWVSGALAYNIWSFGGTPGLAGTRYNYLMAQPFVNYNFDKGWYVGTAPIITANWFRAGNNAWTLPAGGLVGKVVKIEGGLALNFSVGAYYNALRPQFGSTWQLRTLVTIIY
jgi:hypothetical protein